VGGSARIAGITLQVIKRTELHTFQVAPRGGRLNAVLAGCCGYRWLVRDYERRPEHHEAMVYWATVLSMTRRLARCSSDPPINQRWGKPRPVLSTPDPTLA
jgi:hypothetical protein